MNKFSHGKAELQKMISVNKGVLVYFYNDNCAPCITLRPKVQAMVNDVFPLLHLEFIDSIKCPDLPVTFGVFSSPSILVFFEGKEFLRESKFVSIEALQEKIKRYYVMVFGI